LNKISILRMARIHKTSLAKSYTRLETLPQTFLNNDDSLEQVVIDYRGEKEGFWL
jgi:hypothetical protein